MKIPFHPDETSLLYQGRDLEILLSSPGTLAWDPARSDDYDQRYRALNAPLAKYVIAISRRLIGYGPEHVATDWNWEKSWQENKDAGALPDDRLLQAARTGVTILLPVSMLILTACGYLLAGKRAAYLTALLFAMHALILVHNRRAMSEGVMILGVCLAILGLLLADRHPWLAALGAGIAFNAKYSTAPLLLISLVACLWVPAAQEKRSKKILKNFVIFVLVLAIVLVGLNPFLWSDPVHAAAELWQARQTLVSEQVLALKVRLPEQVLDSLAKRLAALLGHLFLSPPQFAEVGNYLQQTTRQAEAYLSFPLHQLLRGNVGGALFFVLTLFGIIVSYRGFSTVRASTRRMFLLLGMATFVQACALLVAIPLPFQRYYLPLVPFVCLWTALGLNQFGRKQKQAAS